MNENLPPRTLVIKDWLRYAANLLAGHGIPTPRLDSELILANAIGKPRTYLHAHCEDIIAKRVLDKANEDLNQRLNRVPIAYITGKKEFYGREFFVTPDTLIPRPESETVVEFVKDIVAMYPQKSELRVIDVGTGSGVLGITTKLELTHLDVTISDISDKALGIAKKNTDKLGAKVKIIKSNLLEAVPYKLDIIIANLPYVDKIWERSHETDYEPIEAIFADDEGLELIKQLIISSKQKLNSRGFLVLESDPRQHESIEKFASQNGFKKTDDLGFIQSFRLLD